jgi:very-short-patch-repair endonuclease
LMASRAMLCVLKSKKDEAVLLERRLYRIPVGSCPKIKAGTFYFYQPKTSGSCVRYFASPERFTIRKRAEVLPEEAWHRRADRDYYVVSFRRINRLKKKITNTNGLRVAFGFFDPKRVKRAKEVTDLFGVLPVERLLEKELRERGIPFKKEFTVRLAGGKRARLDFAALPVREKLNIECDSQKWHGIKANRIKDKARDEELRGLGWSILRLKEKEIASNIGSCIRKVKAFIGKKGGNR